MMKSALLMCLLAVVLWVWWLRPSWHMEVTPRVGVLGLELGLTVSVDLSRTPGSDGEQPVVRACVADTAERVSP